MNSKHFPSLIWYQIIRIWVTTPKSKCLHLLPKTYRSVSTCFRRLNYPNLRVQPLVNFSMNIALTQSIGIPTTKTVEIKLMGSAAPQKTFLSSTILVRLPVNATNVKTKIKVTILPPEQINLAALVLISIINLLKTPVVQNCPETHVFHHNTIQKVIFLNPTTASLGTQTGFLNKKIHIDFPLSLAWIGIDPI